MEMAIIVLAMTISVLGIAIAIGTWLIASAISKLADAIKEHDNEDDYEDY